MSESGNIIYLWERLAEDDAGTGITCLRTATSAPCDVFAAMHKPSNRRALFIEVRSELVAPIVEYPESVGFALEPQQSIPGRHGRVRLVLSSVDEDYLDVFTILCADIITRLLSTSSELDAVRVFVNRLNHWQAFFRRNAMNGLGREAQQGLYAELLTLRDVVAPKIGIGDAISMWRGPLGTNQDFELPGLGLEVKSSSASTQQKLFISNPRQLDTTGLEFLFLLLWSLDVRQGDQRTLPNIVDEIRELIGANTPLNEMFSDRLLAIGYVDGHRAKYESTSYTVRERRFFHVIEGFPRIDINSIAPSIGDVRFSIELSACTPYRITDEQAFEVLGQIHGQ